ncbi:MAG: Tim44-like domain-containing protein, partial [Rubrivivax sp.]|nr:Tim44-like domain-containing protein [Rubrivivax sp.]
GLAAGLGLAALMSHLGMSGEFGSLLMMALMAVAAFFAIRFLMRRFGPAASAQGNAGGMQYAAAGAGAGTGSPTQVAWPQPGGASSAAPVAEPVAAEQLAAPAAAGVSRAFVPASFDAEGFGRIAKMIFIRLQAANDARDLDDLRKFTTPEMFAEARLEIQERGTKTQQTDVVRIESEVLDVANEGEQQIVSVRFHGQVVEEAGAAAVNFDEIWHLVKPHDDSRSWAIAGIEQRQ